MLALLALMTFAALLLGGYAVSGWIREREEAKRGLGARLERMTGFGHDALASPLLRDQRLSRIELLNRLLGRLSLVRRTVRMIGQAGLKKRPGEVLLYIPLLAVTGFFLVVLLGGSPLLGMVAGGFAGSLPLLVVHRMRRKRAALFAEQLPDALDLIRAALQAGHGFIGALSVVAEEFPDPIAQEFRRVIDEVRLGLPFRDALHNLADRVDDANLPIFVIGVLVAQEVGGNLAEVMDNLGHTIRERFKILRETRVLTAQGRLSAGVLTALPLLVGLCMYAFNHKYFEPMLTTKAGHQMMAYAMASIFVGRLVINRLIKLRV